MGSMKPNLECGKIAERVWRQTELGNALGLDYWRVLKNEVAVLSVCYYRGSFIMKNVVHDTDYRAYVFEVDFHRVEETNHPEGPTHGAWEIAEYRWKEAFGDFSPSELRGTFEFSAGRDYRILGRRQVED